MVKKKKKHNNFKSHCPRWCWIILVLRLWWPRVCGNMSVVSHYGSLSTAKLVQRHLVGPRATARISFSVQGRLKHGRGPPYTGLLPAANAVTWHRPLGFTPPHLSEPKENIPSRELCEWLSVLRGKTSQLTMVWLLDDKPLRLLE